MSSRAEYYREYRKRKKMESGSTESEFAVSVMHDLVAEMRSLVAEVRALRGEFENVAQQLQQTKDELQYVAQQLQHSSQQLSQHVAQQESSQEASKDVPYMSFDGMSLGDAKDMLNEMVQQTKVAQQTQQTVAQQHDEAVLSGKPKRKGSFPPSSPPSLSPQTPLYSPPLLSPQPPKEKPRAEFSILAGEAASATFPDEIVDNPDAPLIEQGRGQQRDIATWAELQEAAKFVWEETQSDSLQNAFFDWIEYKHGRGAKEFYTRKGLLAEGKHFVRRHFEDFNVVRAVERAIASNWQGWDHK